MHNINAKITLHISVSEIAYLYDLFYSCAAYHKAHEIDIIFSNVMDFTEELFKIYEIELLKIADLIIFIYQTKHQRLAVNIITDALVAVPNRPLDCVICEKCPCNQCIPDSDIFEKHTGYTFIPPENFCKKAFLELKIARYFNQIIPLVADVSDINHLDWRELKLLEAKLPDF